MNPTEKTKAKYQPWNEDVFKADPFVQYMTPLQRWMYRTLCQSAFFCAERPYLPDNDSLLWMLAGCETPEQWSQHGAPVRAMFTSIEIEGVKLLSRKRLVDDWTRIEKAYTAQTLARSEAGRKAGIASGEARRNARDPIYKEEEGTKLNEGERNGTKLNDNPTKPNHSNLTKLTVQAGDGQVGSQDPLIRACGECPPPQHPTSGRLAAPTSGVPLPDASPAAGLKPTHEGQVKGAGRENLPVLTFQDLQQAWTDYKAKEESDISIGLPKMGWVKLEATLREFHLLDRIPDVQAAFKVWLRDRYEPTVGASEEIKRPLAVFVNDAVRYVTELEKS